MYGTGWTVAALTGVNLGIPLRGVFGNDMGIYDGFLDGAKSIGEILLDNGYKNIFYMGSDATFADRKTLLENHGDYEIFDYYSAIKSNDISSDYNVNWGFEDSKLFDYAKKELRELSRSSQPFNMQILTSDTHPTEGYIDSSCEIDDSYSSYENSYRCTDKIVGSFVNWIKKQSFYKNTTIVILGDHLNMYDNLIHKSIPEDYKRSTYDAFLNSSVSSECTNNRIITSFDMYPTILVSLGVKINGERLALGTNLFSCKKTVSEEVGVEKEFDFLARNSNYYNKCFVADNCNN